MDAVLDWRGDGTAREAFVRWLGFNVMSGQRRAVERFMGAADVADGGSQNFGQHTETGAAGPDAAGSDDGRSDGQSGRAEGGSTARVQRRRGSTGCSFSRSGSGES